MKTKLFCILFIFAVLVGIISCNSTPSEIPDDMTAAQLLQAGQDASSSLNYKAAEKYFVTVISRYGLDNAIYVEARYELGCMYLKQKKYEKAKFAFDEIISMYENSLVGDLPPAFEKLAKLKLDQIPAKKK